MSLTAVSLHPALKHVGATQAAFQAEAAAARNLLASLDVSPVQPSTGAATAAAGGMAARGAVVGGTAAGPYTGQPLDAQMVQQQLLHLQYQQAQYMQAAGMAHLQGPPLVQVGSAACVVERQRG